MDEILILDRWIDISDRNRRAERKVLAQWFIPAILTLREDFHECEATMGVTSELQVRLGFMVRPYFQNKQPGHNDTCL